MSERILRNEFSWSVSRDNTFLECPRQYYYRYYGYWSGWEHGADARTREIYVLKNVKHRQMWMGEVVHDCIKRSLTNLKRGIRVLELPQILQLTRERMRTDFRASRAGRYRENPKHECGLFEHEYGVEISDAEWRAAAEQVDHCLRNFYESDVYAEISRTPKEDILEVEELHTFDMDGIDVVIKPDCAIRKSDHIVVWDWKTGRHESDTTQLQMACYSWYAAHQYEIPVRHVTTRRFELYTGTVHDESLSERAVEDLLGYIRGSIEDMKALLDDPDRNLASEEAFDRVNQLRTCRRCSFLRVCRPPVSGLERLLGDAPSTPAP